MKEDFFLQNFSDQTFNLLELVGLSAIFDDLKGQACVHVKTERC